jgi:hypothetical protein
MRPILACSLVVLVLLFASRQGSTSPHRLVPPLTNSQDTVIATLLLAGQQFGTTEQQIRQRLGRVDSVRATPIQNRYDSTQTDTVVRLFYHDLTLGLYRVAKGHRDILGHVILSGIGHRIPFDIGVGTDRRRLLALLGKPPAILVDDEGVETLEYQGPMEDPSKIRFVLRNERVRRIEWSYYIE